MGWRTPEGSQIFAEKLYHYIYGEESMSARFEDFTNALGMLPRKQTRVQTWPLQTVFGFIACPSEHIFLKPRVTQAAARKYAYDFYYKSTPNWGSYETLLNFANEIRSNTLDLHPVDLIDIQSFMWVLGSEEYPD